MVKQTEAETTRNAILRAFWFKGRKEFVELTGEEIAKRTGQPHTIIAANLGFMDGLVSIRRVSNPKTFVLSKNGERRAMDLMKPKAAPPKPKPQPKAKAPEPVHVIADEREYAKALAKLAGAENAAAYKAGTIAVYNSPPPRERELTQLQSRVLFVIQNEAGKFTAQTIADKIDSNRPQVAVAMRDLKMKGLIAMRRCQKTSTYTIETSPAGREMPKSEISDPPQPKRAIRVVEAYLTANNMSAENAHVNRISLPAETWAAE